MRGGTVVGQSEIFNACYQADDDRALVFRSFMRETGLSTDLKATAVELQENGHIVVTLQDGRRFRMVARRLAELAVFAGKQIAEG